MDIICPHCGTGGKGEDSLAGREVCCPECGKRFMAPETAREADREPKVHFYSEEKTAKGKAGMERNEDIILPAPKEMAVMDIVRTSWQLGRERRFAVICRVGTLLLFAAMLVVTLLFDGEDGLLMSLFKGAGISGALLSFIGAILTVISMGLSGNTKAGMPFVGIRHSKGYRVGLQTCFRGFRPQHFKALFIAGIMKTVVTMMGFVLLVVPGIYLSIAYWFALPLILDRGLLPWQALEVSRKAVTKVWFKVAGVYTIIAVLPFIPPAMICGQVLGGLLQKMDAQGMDFGKLSDVTAGWGEVYAQFSSDVHLLALCVAAIFALWMFLLPCFFASFGVIYGGIFTSQEEDKEGGEREEVI